MLNMNYFDKNGNKWSIEQGDWESPLITENIDKKIISGKRILFFLFTLLILISCLIPFMR